MSDVLDFPPGVTSGEPFTSLTAAVSWLAAAAAGDHGPMHLAAFGGFAGPWTLDPVPADTIPTSVYEFTTSNAYTGPWNCGSGQAGIWFELRDPASGLEVPLFTFTDEFAAMAVGITPDAWLHYWRIVAGYEKAARDRFRTAKSRSTAAKQLAVIEDALDSVAAHTVTSINRWVSTVWVDAQALGLDVHPGTAPPTTPPVGTIRLGLTK